MVLRGGVVGFRHSVLIAERLRAVCGRGGFECGWLQM